MRTAALLLVVLAFAAMAQTPTAVFDAVNSQVNTAPSCLVMLASVVAPGNTSSSFPGFMGFFSPSKTFAYTCDGTVTGAAPGTLAYSGRIEGNANMPFLLAVGLITTGIPCGGAAGPCMTGGSLFSDVLTPSGRYHLGANPTILLDGIAGLAPPASLFFNGQYPIFGNIVVDTVANGGQDLRLAVQGLTVDPSAASGFTFTACLNIDQWIEN
ncbi:MAG: hypothetical protein CMJ83_11825 [Planctomycetes bacterium]|nr:hypothetical protein [Planctomycetota bacterium]